MDKTAPKLDHLLADEYRGRSSFWIREALDALETLYGPDYDCVAEVYDRVEDVVTSLVVLLQAIYDSDSIAETDCAEEVRRPDVSIERAISKARAVRGAIR